MKTAITLLITCFAHTLASAEEFTISAKEPVIVVAPSQWKSTMEKSPGRAFPVNGGMKMGVSTFTPLGS
ncbi:MAG: hypothetical protein HY299_15470 [Verrucomicrobia bacterium]|nr:hypothetical protein [Verrucomicrobiota bacterium]